MTSEIYAVFCNIEVFKGKKSLALHPFLNLGGLHESRQEGGKGEVRHLPHTLRDSWKRSTLKTEGDISNINTINPKYF
jgi:hypothetical protein